MIDYRSEDLVESLGGFGKVNRSVKIGSFVIGWRDKVGGVD